MIKDDGRGSVTSFLLCPYHTEETSRQKKNHIEVCTSDNKRWYNGVCADILNNRCTTVFKEVC